MQGIAYRGKHFSQQNERFEEVVITVNRNCVVEIPGESEFCFYDLETGEIKDI